MDTRSITLRTLTDAALDELIDRLRSNCNGSALYRRRKWADVEREKRRRLMERLRQS